MRKPVEKQDGDETGDLKTIWHLIRLRTLNRNKNKCYEKEPGLIVTQNKTKKCHWKNKIILTVSYFCVL